MKGFHGQVLLPSKFIAITSHVNASGIITKVVVGKYKYRHVAYSTKELQSLIFLKCVVICGCKVSVYPLEPLTLAFQSPFNCWLCVQSYSKLLLCIVIKIKRKEAVLISRQWEWMRSLSISSICISTRTFLQNLRAFFLLYWRLWLKCDLFTRYRCPRVLTLLKVCLCFYCWISCLHKTTA